MAKAKTTTGNRFPGADFGSIMDFGKFAEQFRFPGVDSKTLIETQRRNMEAVTKANQVAFEGAQAVMQRQVEILRETMDETTKAVRELSSSDKPEDIWAKQAELLKESYEHGLANLRELTELSTRANVEAADLLTHRVTDTLDELKGAFASSNGAARETTPSKAAQ
jgi:phasin family protein